MCRGDRELLIISTSKKPPACLKTDNVGAQRVHLAHDAVPSPLPGQLVRRPAAEQPPPLLVNVRRRQDVVGQEAEAHAGVKGAALAGDKTSTKIGLVPLSETLQPAESQLLALPAGVRLVLLLLLDAVDITADRDGGSR